MDSGKTKTVLVGNQMRGELSVKRNEDGTIYVHVVNADKTHSDDEAGMTLARSEARRLWAFFESELGLR